MFNKPVAYLFALLLITHPCHCRLEEEQSKNCKQYYHLKDNQPP